MKISLRLAVSSILGAIAYLGLAIWGMGGFSAFFGHPQLTLIAIATLLMVVAALYSEVNLSSGEQEDQGNRWVLPVFGVIGLLSGFVPAYSDRIDFCTFGGEGLRWLGALLFILGGGLRLCRYSSSAGASAGWWRSSPTTAWWWTASTATCATPATWACW